MGSHLPLTIGAAALGYVGIRVLTISHGNLTTAIALAGAASRQPAAIATSG
jgi:hypothetical protein